MIEEPEPTQTGETEVEGEGQGMQEDAAEEMMKEGELSVDEMDEHRKMPEHPGRDSDSGDSEPENETEKWLMESLSLMHFGKLTEKKAVRKKFAIFTLTFIKWLPV